MRLLLLFCFLLNSCAFLLPVGIVSGTVSAAKDKTIGESLDDTAITSRIKKEFISKGFRDLYAKISVEVVQGRVLYTGVVQTEDDIVTAVDIAWKQLGVKEVINELEVDENSNSFNASQFTKDSWITTQIKSKTFFNRDIKFVNYTVVTSKNIVYLFGIARSEEELEKVAGLAASVKGVEKVVSYVKIKDSAQNSSQNATN